MASEWRKNLDTFLQEHMLAVSTVFTVISVFLIYIGIMGDWYFCIDIWIDYVWFCYLLSLVNKTLYGSI